MKDNIIKQRVNVIVSVAEQNAAENCILENWYNQTATAARQIGEQVDSKITEFENLSLALSALQGNVPVVTVDVLLDGIEALYKSIDAYVAYPETAYGFAIQTTKDALRNTGSILYESIQSLSVLERALGMLEIPQIKTSSTVEKPTVEEEPTADVVDAVEEGKAAETEEQLTITLDAEDNGGIRIGVTKEEPSEVENEPPSVEPETVEPEQKPEPVEQSEEYLNDNRTLYGIPVSDLKKMTPGVDIDAILGPEDKTASKEETKPAPEASAPKNPGVRPQKLSNGFSAVQIPGFPADQFMLSEKNLLVDRYTGRVIRPFPRRGSEYVSVRHYDSGRIEEIPFDDIIRGARGKTEPGDQKASAEKVEVEEVNRPERWVWVNWLPDIPKTKYKVFEDGRVWNTVDEKWMGSTSGSTIILSAGDVSSAVPGVRSAQMGFTRQSLVVRAFHPEYRDRTKIYVKFKDGNPKNCALWNLEF